MTKREVKAQRYASSGVLSKLMCVVPRSTVPATDTWSGTILGAHAPGTKHASIAKTRHGIPNGLQLTTPSEEDRSAPTVV